MQLSSRGVDLGYRILPGSTLSYHVLEAASVVMAQDRLLILHCLEYSQSES